MNSQPALLELRRAAAALQAGAFRDPSTLALNGDHDRPIGRASGPFIEPTVTVTGATSGLGASTFALALAAALAQTHACGARVLECNTLRGSALVATTNAELDTDEAGWRQGLRETSGEPVLVQRAPRAAQPSGLPLPAALDSPVGVTVLDPGWPLVAVDGWLKAAVVSSSACVVIAQATVPGLERLEALLAATAADAIAMVRGPRPRRWPAVLRAAIGPHTSGLIEAERLVAVLNDRALHLHGPSPAALPRSLTDCADAVADLIDLPPITASADHFKADEPATHMERKLAC